MQSSAAVAITHKKGMVSVHNKKKNHLTKHLELVNIFSRVDCQMMLSIMVIECGIVVTSDTQ